MLARFQLRQTRHEIPLIVNRSIYHSGITPHLLEQLSLVRLLGCETDIVHRRNTTNHRPWRDSAIWALSVGVRLQEARAAPGLHAWIVSGFLHDSALTVTPSLFNAEHVRVSSSCAFTSHKHTFVVLLTSCVP